MDPLTPHAHPMHDPSSITPDQAAFFSLFRAMNLNRLLMTRRLGEHDMHPGQALCLGMLVHHDGITQSALAEHLNVTRPTVTVMLQKMEKAGLIQRHPDETDQRCTRINITPEGRELHGRMHEVLRCIGAETFGRLDPGERDELRRLLELLSDKMESALHGESKDGARNRATEGIGA